jgi:CRISPR-associated protein Cas5d
LNPIKWISVRRNEVGKEADMQSQGFFVEDYRQQRAGLFLRAVRYRIYGWFEFFPPENRKKHERYGPYWADSDEQSQYERRDETEAKYAAMFERRAKKGQCFHRPYLGCREFPCDFCLIDNAISLPERINPDYDLGWMLYDLNYDDPANPKPEFFKACLNNNAVNTDRRELEVRS